MDISFSAVANIDVSLSDWVINMFETLPSESHGLFATMLWSAWFARNQYYFEDRKLEVPFVHVMGQSLLDEFNRAQMRGQLGKRVQRVVPEVWIPPKPGFVKLNTDATLLQGNDVGMGGIARDENGLVLWCFAERERGQTDADTAEALAALKGMKLALERNV
ncbi:hypothetical protein ACS0TY_019104 [Phlomoides rotata]